MKILFYVNEKRKWERRLCEVLTSSAEKQGIEVIKDTGGYQGKVHDVDAVMIVGIGKNKRQCRDAYVRAGKKAIYIDKGYLRQATQGVPLSSSGKRTSHWRIIVDGDHPHAYLNNIQRPSDRFDKLGLVMQPRREGGEAILLAGSSQRYCSHNRIAQPTAYAMQILKELADRGIDREIIYRPKPRWRHAVPVPGTTYSTHLTTLKAELDRSKVLITHGSNAALDSIMYGVPVIILGTSIASPLTANTLDDMECLDFPDDEQRYQWACNVAYCQWTPDEIERGLAWETLSERFN